MRPPCIVFSSLSFIFFSSLADSGEELELMARFASRTNTARDQCESAYIHAYKNSNSKTRAIHCVATAMHYDSRDVIKSGSNRFRAKNGEVNALATFVLHIEISQSS